MNSENILPFFKNFYEYIDVYNDYHANYDQYSQEFSLLKKQQQLENSDAYVADFKGQCYYIGSSNFPLVVDSLRNFNLHYKKLPDASSLNQLNCSLSKFLNNYQDNIFNIKNTHGNNLSDLMFLLKAQLGDFIEGTKVFKGLLNDLFLSDTIFKDTQVDYLSAGANGSVDLIKIKGNDGQEFKMIQKSVFNESVELYDILRELIVGTKLLFNVRQKTPNFTAVYGIYTTYGPLILDNYDEYIRDYPKLKLITDYKNEQGCETNNPDDICEFLKTYNMFIYTPKSEKDQNLAPVPLLGNLNTDYVKLFLLTEFSKGKSLDYMLENLVQTNNPNSGKIVMSVFMQIIRSLLYANDKIGYVHNDLHTENIIIRELENEEYLEELIYPDQFKHQKVKYLAQIIDYGYSSINNYVNYFVEIMSDETSNSHNDIFRIYSSVLKKLSYLLFFEKVKNDAMFDIVRHLTIHIGGFYFENLKNVDLNTPNEELETILLDYFNSDMFNSYEYIPLDFNFITNNKPEYSPNALYNYLIKQYKKFFSNDNFLQLGNDNVTYFVDKDEYNFVTNQFANSNYYNENIESILNEKIPVGLSDKEVNSYNTVFQNLNKLFTYMINLENDPSLNVDQKAYLLIVMLMNFIYYLRIYTHFIFINNNAQNKVSLLEHDIESIAQSINSMLYLNYRSLINPDENITKIYSELLKFFSY